MDALLDTGGPVTVPPELVRSSKALFDDFRGPADGGGVTLDSLIPGEPWTSHTSRSLSSNLPESSLTVRFEHASACGVLRVTCTPIVEGVLTVGQAGRQPIRLELTDGAATVVGVAPSWTSLVIHPDHRGGAPVRAV
jgi:hypothetical protein